MKANTPELMKFKRLQRRLEASVPELVGYLELLWIATAKNAPEGDIGRFSNEDIAIACYWTGDPDSFVEALVECGWLDTSDEWRLLVHDWAQHAPSYIHGALKRHGRNFRDPSTEPPKEAPKDPPKETPIGTPSEDAPTKPNLTKPNQANSIPASPSQAKPPNGHAAGLVGGGLFEPDWEEVMRQCLRLDKAVIKTNAAAISADDLWQLGWVANQVTPGLFAEVASKVLSRDVKKPKGYIEAALRRECDDRGLVLVAMMACVPSRPKAQVTQ